MKKLIPLLVLALAGCRDRMPESPPPEPQAQSQPETGWTGRTHPQDVIAARQEIMAHMEALMMPIDLHRAEGKGDPARLRELAGEIGTMLHAVPHLFPSTTNLYEAANPTPPTVALPAIWQNFDSFYVIAEQAVQAAEAMAAAEDPGALRTAAAAVRAGCDGCHALYLRKYEPPVIKDSDYTFDFDSALTSN